MPKGIYKKTKEMKTGKHMLGRKLSKETRDKMSVFHSNRKCSEETKKKMSKSHKGKVFSAEHKSKISKTHKGEKHPNWQGGKSFELYSTDWADDLRESIRKRDNYVCRECGIHQDELDGLHKKLDVHHIDYNKHNLSPENLVTLCKSCHAKTNFNRDFWFNKLKEKKI